MPSNANARALGDTAARQLANTTKTAAQLTAVTLGGTQLTTPAFSFPMRIGFGQLKLDDLAGPNVSYLRKTKIIQRMTNGLALGVQHPVF